MSTQPTAEPRRRHSDRSGAVGRPGTRRSNDRGYVMVITALFVTSMLAVAALVVDLGGFYVEASKIQRATDAAALGGVVWLPNVPKATAEAKKIAAENGYTDGVNATVTVKRVGLYQLSVSIKADGKLYFGKSFTNEVKLARSGEAQFTLPVPLGSSTSAAGMGDYTFPNNVAKHNIWLSIHAPCSGQENGDLLTPFSIANNRRCPGDRYFPSSGIPNPDYDENGYTFAIEVRSGAGQLRVQGYDVGECTNNGGPRLQWQLYSADDTPLDNSDNPLFGTNTPGNTSGCDALTTMFTIPAGAKTGRWILRIRNNPGSTYGYDPNRFGLWVKRSNDTVPCTVKTTATCPNVFALENLPVYAEAPSAAATFDLAEITSEHAEKAIVLQLFDPGEGARSIQVLDPNGNPMAFNYQTVDGDYGPVAADTCSGTSGTGPCLNTNLQGPALYPSLGTSWKYNARKVILEIPLPAKATMDAYPDDWFQLRYRSLSSGVTDQTTWSASISGDPVHLIG
ncbi:MAG: pilus assembly protein TadG-related protein [Microthrixaceae bacterium]